MKRLYAWVVGILLISSVVVVVPTVGIDAMELFSDARYNRHDDFIGHEGPTDEYGCHPGPNGEIHCH